MDIIGLTIDKLHKALAERKTTVTEVCRATLERIDRLNPQLNAFITVTDRTALERAAALDAQLSNGAPLKALMGVPIAIKDNICTLGIRTTCGSKILDNYIPIYNATAIERIIEAGAVIVGKANCDEFAMGSSTENSAYGPARNPWNRDYVPGGSSGGSAVAVAADMCVVALGSDTGGSVRLPAAFTGVFGLKPTYGRVSRYGLVAYGSSLDQIGCFGKTAADTARVLGVIAGRDPYDSTSSTRPVDDYLSHLTGDLTGLRIGLPKEFFGAGLDAEVKSCIEAAIKKLEELGATVVDVSLPHTDYAIATYYIIATAEASSNLARYDGVRYGFRAEEARTLQDMYRRTRDLGFGAEVKRRIMLGTYVLSSGYYDAYYLKAQKVRALIEKDFRDAFEHCDVIATPTSPTPPFKLGEKMDDPLSMYLSDIYTVTINLAGVPGISVPCGFSSNGLPIGLQLIGKQFGEAKALNVAHAYEKASPIEKRAVLG